MKRICFFTLILFLAISSRAQVELGLFGGPHIAMVKYTIKNVKQPSDSKFGFHIGVNTKIAFENKLSFVPAFSYKLMGYKVEFNRPSFPPDMLAKDNNTSFHQIDIDALLQFDLSKNPGHFFVRGGPSLGFLFAGKEEFNLETGEHINRKMKFSLVKNYTPFLAGAVLQFGHENPAGFLIYAHYVHGLISMNNEKDGPSIRPRFIGITLGKIFRK